MHVDQETLKIALISLWKSIFRIVYFHMLVDSRLLYNCHLFGVVMEISCLVAKFIDTIYPHINQNDPSDSFW